MLAITVSVCIEMNLCLYVSMYLPEYVKIMKHRGYMMSEWDFAHLYLTFILLIFLSPS